LLLNNNGRRPRVHSDTHTGHSAITIFTEGKEGHSPQPSKQEARQTKEQLAARPHCETVTQDKTWLVKAKENVTLAPRCRHVVMRKVEFEKGQKPPSLICIEPVQIHIEGVFPARTLSRIESNVPKFPTLASKVVHAETDVSGSCAHVILANFSDEELTVPKATVLGVAEEMSESLVNDINEVQTPAKGEPNKPPRRRKNEALYQKLLQGKLDHLTEEERQVIEPILWKYAHVFHDEETNDFPGTNIVEHCIPVGDVQPIRRTLVIPLPYDNRMPKT